MTRLFISYNSADHDEVAPLAGLLESSGFTPIFDRWSFVGGEPWVDRIERELLACPVTLVCFGPSGQGRVQRNEIQLALDLAWRDPARRVVAALLPGATDLEPGFLSLSTYVDLRAGIAAARIERLLAALSGAEPGPPNYTHTPCPYPGLAPFSHRDTEVFFGRERETQGLHDALRRGFDEPRARRMITLIGASGAGKSSLVRAGLIPALVAERGATGPRWQVLLTRPGRRPITALTRALLRAHAVRVPTIEHQLRQQLLDDPEAIESFYVLNRVHEDARLVLVVDQCEELLTQTESERERDAFIAAMLQLSRSTEAAVVATLRADFLAPFLGLSPDVGRTLQQTQRLILPPSSAELEGAITRPAALRGRRLEPALVRTLVRELERAPGHLPLLQMTLTQLWNASAERTIMLRTYHDLGQLAGAISRHADTVLADLDQPECARRLLCGLVHIGAGTPDSRLRRPRDELRELELGLDLDPLIDTLVNRRLLATDADNIELIHESLIHEWTTLREWIDADRVALAATRELEQAAHRWREAGGADDHVWRGGRLEEARRQTSTSDVGLSATAQAFLRASVELQARERAAALEAEQTLREARADAENRLQEARTVAELIHTQLTHELTSSLDAPRVRGELLEASAQLLERLGGQDNPTLERAVMVSLNERGDAALTHGELEVASALYSRALAIAERRAQQQLGRFFEDDLGIALANLGAASEARGDLDRAIELHQRALALDRARAERAPDGDILGDVSGDLGRLARVLWTAGRTSEALALAEEAVDIDHQRQTDDPEAPELVRELSASLGSAARLAFVCGEAERAQAWLDRSLSLDRDAYARAPDSTEALRDLSVTLGLAVDLATTRGELGDAARFAREAHELDVRWCAADPDNRQAMLDSSQSARRLAELEHRLGRHDEAWHTLQLALTCGQVLVERNPDDEPATTRLFLVLHELAELCIERGQFEQAETHERRALELAKRLVAQGPTTISHHLGLATAWDRLGDLRREASDLDGALACFEASLRVLRALSHAFPDARVERDRSVAEIKLGEALAYVGRFAEAQTLLEGALTMRKQLVEAQPGAVEPERNVALAHSSLAEFHRLRGQSTGAERHGSAALEIERKLLARSPHDHRLRRDLAVSLDALGDARIAADPARAREAFAEALDIRRDLLGDDPDDFRARQDLIASLQRMGDAQNDPTQRLPWYREALALDRAAPNWREHDHGRRNIAVSLEKIGIAQLALSAHGQPYTTLRECYELRRALVEEHPEAIELSRELAEASLRLSMAAAGCRAFEETLAVLRTGRETLVRWLSHAPADDEALAWLADFDEGLALPTPDSASPGLAEVPSDSDMRD